MDGNGTNGDSLPPVASTSRQRRSEYYHIPETQSLHEVSPQRYFDYHSLDRGADPVICIDNGWTHVDCSCACS